MVRAQITEFCSEQFLIRLVTLPKRHARNISGKGSSALYRHFVAAGNTGLTWYDGLFVFSTHVSNGKMLVVQQPT